LPPMAPRHEYMPQSHLPTAPNSPVSLPELRLSRPDQEATDKATRIAVGSLLG
jgi:hypothetical protein